MSALLLVGEKVTLRPARNRDKAAWNEVRAENREWLAPWEATLPIVPDGITAEDHLSKAPSFRTMVRTLNREAAAGRSYSFLIFYEGALVGQISMGGVIYGAMRGAHIGYWIDRNYANRGLTTDAVNTLTDFGFKVLGLHRIEINIRPENDASCRVALKAGYHFEGDRPQYLHIAGVWRDHKCFVKVNDSIK